MGEGGWMYPIPTHPCGGGGRQPTLTLGGLCLRSSAKRRVGQPRRNEGVAAGHTAGSVATDIEMNLPLSTFYRSHVLFSLL